MNKPSQKGLTGGWSKYGGARQHVIKTKIAKKWYCQSCGKERPKEMTPFLYEFVEGDHIRICATCLHDGVIILSHKRIQIEINGWT